MRIPRLHLGVTRVNENVSPLPRARLAAIPRYQPSRKGRVSVPRFATFGRPRGPGSGHTSPPSFAPRVANHHVRLAPPSVLQSTAPAMSSPLRSTLGDLSLAPGQGFGNPSNLDSCRDEYWRCASACVTAAGGDPRWTQPDQACINACLSAECQDLIAINGAGLPPWHDYEPPPDPHEEDRSLWEMLYERGWPGPEPPPTEYVAGGAGRPSEPPFLKEASGNSHPPSWFDSQQAGGGGSSERQWTTAQPYERCFTWRCAQGTCCRPQYYRPDQYFMYCWPCTQCWTEEIPCPPGTTPTPPQPHI